MPSDYGVPQRDPNSDDPLCGMSEIPSGTLNSIIDAMCARESGPMELIIYKIKSRDPRFEESIKKLAKHLLLPHGGLNPRELRCVLDGAAIAAFFLARARDYYQPLEVYNGNQDVYTSQTTQSSERPLDDPSSDLARTLEGDLE